MDVYQHYLYILECPYQHVGCYKDSKYRAMRLLEGVDSTFLQGHYRTRGKESIRYCYLEALMKGFVMFGLQDGGQCWGGTFIDHKHSKYGLSKDCHDGKGGIWSNDVYKINNRCQAINSKSFAIS